MSRIRCICGSLVLLSVVLVQVAAVRKRQGTEEANHRVFGRYTQQQVIEMSRPLITDVLPSQDPLDLSAGRFMSLLHDGKILHEWYVDCTDLRTYSTLYLVWDAETGQLYAVSVNYPPTVAASLPNRLSTQDAVATARDWLALLGLLENWSVSGNPMHHGQTWAVTFRQGRRKATVSVLDSDGRLIYAGVGESR